MPLGLPQLGENGESWDENWMDIYNHFLSNRMIYLSNGLDKENSDSISGVLVALDLQEREVIHLYVNHSDGMLIPSLFLHNIMKAVPSPVHTIGLGQTRAMGTFILAGGESTHRIAFPNAKVTLSEPTMEYTEVFNVGSTVLSDIRLAFQTLLERLERITKKPGSVIREDMARAEPMSVEEAMTYGIVDAVIDTVNTPIK